MTQADSVHRTPPLNTSALTPIAGLDWLDIKDDASPQDIFRAIGKPRAERLNVPGKRAASGKMSAGLLLYRHSGDGIEVLLGHPGGPFWRNRDLASWSIPKGLITESETPLAAANREFAEETGHRPRGQAKPLGEAKQPSGKIVHVWAVEGDWDAGSLKSNMFDMEWPPRSGRRLKFPELDSARWFGMHEAHSKILKGQAVFLDRLLETLASS